MLVVLAVDIARLGDDEFAVLIPPQADPLPQAEALCHALLALFDAPFTLSGQPCRLSASSGGCLGPMGHETASDRLASADFKATHLDEVPVQAIKLDKALRLYGLAQAPRKRPRAPGQARHAGRRAGYGLVHISQITHERVEKISDHLREGDVVDVKVLEVEVDKQGRIRLSMKELIG